VCSEETKAIWMFIAEIRDNILDGTVVFTLLFGSELFEDYIGNLAMATMASSELTSDNDNPEKLQDRLKVSGLDKQALCMMDANMLNTNDIFSFCMEY
jgi:hypothetical protein